MLETTVASIRPTVKRDHEKKSDTTLVETKMKIKKKGSVFITMRKKVVATR